VGPKSQSGRGVEEKIPISRGDSNPDHLIVQSVASRYTDWDTPALFAMEVQVLMLLYFKLVMTFSSACSICCL
jgi:hypothetical protein